MKRSSLSSAFAATILVANQFFAYPAMAQEFSVSGNGEGSSNNISYQATQETPINQENSAEINNDVEAQAQTGENEANNNSGEVKIETGDAQVDVEVLNSGNNSNAQIGCCEQDGKSSASIEGNGADSSNNIEIANNSGSTINSTNDLSLHNNVSINTNTGDNEANDNGGDVSIKTGDIGLLAMILNQNLNTANITAGNKNTTFNYSIKNNGSGSTNSIYGNSNSDNQYFVFNTLSLTNNINNSSNTGRNKANGNNGKVFISTGNIYLDVILSNKDINTSKIVDTCCSQEPTPSPTPGGSPNPSDPPQGGSSTPPGSCCSPTTDIPGPGGSSGGPGSVLGASLPQTGGISLWSLTLLALLMLTLGVILRSDNLHAQIKFKKVYREFINSLRFYAFGAYLFTNLKVLPSNRY